MHRQKNELIHCFPQAGRCSPVSRKAGMISSSCMTIAWEDRYQDFSFLPVSIPEHGDLIIGDLLLLSWGQVPQL